MARAPNGTTEGLGSKPTHNTSLKRDPPTQNGEKNTGKTREQDRKDPQAFNFSFFSFTALLDKFIPFPTWYFIISRGIYNKIDVKTGTHRALLYEN